MGWFVLPRLGAAWRDLYWYGVIFIGSRPDFYWIEARVAVWRGVMVRGRGPHPACIQGFAVSDFLILSPDFRSKRNLHFDYSTMLGRSGGLAPSFM